LVKCMFSYDMLADKLIDLANIDWSGRESQRNSCRYGLEMLIATIVNFVLVIITGSLLGILKEAFIYLIAWGSLRLFSGGSHARNHRNCIITFIAVMLVVIYTCKYLLAGVNAGYYEIAALTIAFILNAIYAGNQKRDLGKRKKNKRISLIILTTYLLIVVLGNTVFSANSADHRYMLSVMTGAILAESLFLIPIKKAESKA
jgi:accessory gene regulator B